MSESPTYLSAIICRVGNMFRIDLLVGYHGAHEPKVNLFHNIRIL